MSVNYNIINKSINLGLHQEPIGNGGYIKLLEAPTSADVLIHLNDKNADGIPLKAYHSIEADNIERVYISCNAVNGETIRIAQAKTSKEFKIITPVTDIAVDEIGGYSANALSLIDKVFNPFENIPNIYHAQSDSSVYVEIFSRTFNSCKLKFFLSTDRATLDKLSNGIVYLLVNNLVVASAGGHFDSTSGMSHTQDSYGELILKDGDTVLVKAVNNNQTTLRLYLEEFITKQ